MAACWSWISPPVAKSCVYGVCAFVLRCFSCSHTVLPKDHSLGVIFFLLTFLMLCGIFSSPVYLLAFHYSLYSVWLCMWRIIIIIIIGVRSNNPHTYVRMLFVDYSSAFNTIVPATLVAKLQTLGLNRSLCSWILDFLTGRSQVVRMGNNTSSPLILNTGAPQGCVLSPLLYSLYTHDCTATHSSNVIVKFADDTTW